MEEMKPNKALLFDEDVLTKKDPRFIKDFNEAYKKYLDSTDKNERVEEGVKAAIVVARSFDFENELVEPMREEYINFARQMLEIGCSKEYFNEDALIYYIRALYGQTRIAFPHDPKALKQGNEYVTTLERFTKNHTLKAYGLALRSYILIVFGEEIEMSLEDRIKIAETDLIYATKWDEDNYLAYLALGLIYFDTNSSKFDVYKALTNFTKALSYEDEYVPLDDYLTYDDKVNLMDAAKDLRDRAKSHE